MQNEVRFGWIGETRRSVLCASLTAQIEDWLHSWSLTRPPSTLNVREIDGASRPERKNAAFVAQDDAGCLAIHLGGRDPDAIGCYLVAADGEGDDGLARRMGQDALTDLATRIKRRAGSSMASPFAKTHVPLGLEHARLGAFGVMISLGRLQLELIIDRALADRLAPPIKHDVTRLVPRHAALGSVPLQVRAVIDFGSMNLAHLSDLSVGEILIGDRKLDEPLEIQVEGKGAVASGYLRRLGELRAVTFDGINVQERHEHE
jgi:hypothetical protein